MKKGIKETLAIFGVLLLVIGCFYLAGFRMHYVSSGSMNPTIPKYSLVLSKTVDPYKDIKVNDVVVFTQSGAEMPIMHRIKVMTKTYIITKGDANKLYDSKTPMNHIQEKIIAHVPLLGYCVAAIHSPNGRYIFVGLIILLLIIAFLPDRSRRKEV